jgi:alpha-beta hydrolase superfamily lysophospholipase
VSVAESTSLSERLSFSDRAEPFRLGDERPHVHGYAWRHPAPGASLVLVHGFQSHAQWFAEAADDLVERGFSVFALDRRGSGSSPERPGDITDYRNWVRELAAVIRYAQAESDAPVHVVGHCFGANVALACALTQPLVLGSIVMLTPGVYVLPDYTVGEKLQILVQGLRGSTGVRFRMPQRAELFSRHPDVVEWIRADRLGAPSVTGRCLLQTGRMLRSIRRNTGRVRVPVLVLEAARDRISDNARNRAFLDAALGDRVQWVTFDAEHFLLAEPCRDEVLDTIAEWAGKETR